MSNLAQDFLDIQEQTGAGDTAAAIILLAEVLQSKRLTLDDGDAIAHGIYLGLDKLVETSSPIGVSIGGELNVTTDET